jgi:hypothetical protein
VGTWRGATLLRASCIGVVAFLVAALSLSACSSPTPGVLTQSDIPTSLGVKLNQSASATWEDHFSPRAHCTKAAFVIFSLPEIRVLNVYHQLLVDREPEVASYALSCASTSDSRGAFKSTLRGGGTSSHSVARIGDQAVLANISDGGTRSYIVLWRLRDALGLVLVAGQPKYRQITPGLAESLARRAVARS